VRLTRHTCDYAAGAVGAYTHMENVWNGFWLMIGMKKLFDDLRKLLNCQVKHGN